MKGLGAEVAKNLILAGVKGLTMLDHQQVRSLQLLSAAALGVSKAPRPTPSPAPMRYGASAGGLARCFFGINILLGVKLSHFGARRVCVSSRSRGS